MGDKIIKWFKSLLAGFIEITSNPKNEVDYDDCMLKIKNHKEQSKKIKSLTSDDWS